jgi:TolB-like protein/class 3 adenylate cyclase/Tfp pilus assembly protein PilF
MEKDSRRIAAILAADVAGYSRLVGADETAALAALNLRREIFERLVAEFGGRVFGSVGDSLMAQFPSAINALRCARHLQNAIDEENDTVPADRRMALRIGVNLGDVVEKDGLLYGDGINIAERLQTMAEPGGIVISGAVHEQVRNKLSAGFRSLGFQSLKNIAEPVLSYKVIGFDAARDRFRVVSWFYRRDVRLTLLGLLFVLGGGFLWIYMHAGNAPDLAPRPPAGSPAVTETADSQSIAVLPFADMSADKNQEYMADGMAEELLNLLSQVPDLKVIARTSSFAFKGQKVELAEIARRLNVAYVLEGSVRSSSDRMRITAQLVRTADSTRLWSETFDRPLGDVFAVQDEIAKAVVSELKIKLLSDAPKARERKPEAYALFLKARDIGMQHTPLSYEQSISLYEQALKLDPEYAEAWDGLANNYGYQAINGIRPSAEGFQLASEAAQKALALDPRYAQAHARLGWIAVNYDRDLVSAARHLSNALALDPSNTYILDWSAVLLRRLGRIDQAIEIGEYLVIHDPLNADAVLELGLAHKHAEHWDTAITHYRSALALSPSGIGAHGVIGEVMVLQGNPRAALAEVQLETDPAWRLHVQSLANHALGQSAASAAALAEMIESHGNSYASFIVEEAAFRGDIDLAFEWMDKAALLRDPSLGAIPLSLFCANLHKYSRWHSFLHQHGMAPEQLSAIDFHVTLPE